jgi:aryl-alcohol dehydrogenase-like predicted oxidoreductase
MTFGNEWGFGSEEPTSKRILDEFLERGGNFIDTSNFYTQGHSERIIGEHIGRHPAKRSRAVIATKFSANMAVEDPNAGGASRKSIISACEDSLRRLQTDYIDLYWLHWDDPFTPLEETLSALNALVRGGKVRYIGISDTPGRPGVTAPIIGARTEAQLQDNLAAFAIELDDADLEELNEVSAPRLSFPHAFLNDAVRASYPDMSVNGQSFKAYGL